MRLQYYPWSPETLCLVTNHTHFSKSEKYIWSYFLITNFICFGHFLNAITANLGISIKENFPFSMMLQNEECAMLSEDIQLDMTETSLSPESPSRILFLFWQ